MAKRKVASPEALLAAAVRLFERKGYQNTTVDDIAEAMGIAKPTIYKHVKSKGALLEAAFDSLLGRLREDLDTVVTRERADEQIEALIDVYMRIVHDLRTYFLIFFGEERELPARTRRRFRTMARDLTKAIDEVISRGQEAGVVRGDVEPDVAASLILGMLSSVARWYDPRGRLAPEEIARQVRHLLGGFYVETDPASARRSLRAAG